MTQFTWDDLALARGHLLLLSRSGIIQVSRVELGHLLDAIERAWLERDDLRAKEAVKE